MKILLIGDVVGKKGRQIVASVLPEIKKKECIDLCIANGENLAGGFGITVKVADQMYATGVDVITGGNHIWNKKEIYSIIEEDERLLRPLNYPSGVPGRGSNIYSVNNTRICVINLCGRIFMENLDCPFRTVIAEIEEIHKQTSNIIVDFHAEATSEKIAMGLYLDGMVSAVIGTHTHVQTADERVLPKGTAYITDVGMTGPKDSIIGIKSETIIKKFLTLMPLRFEVQKKGIGIFCGVIVEIDDTTGKALSIKRIQKEVE
jgi:hypothetical protein